MQDIPSIVIIFSILAIGADETAGSATDLGNSYIEAAYSLYGHLVSNPYLSSVQALILLGFSLRGKSKDGQCWQLTGQAVRIAHSIGLHRHISSRSKQANIGFQENSMSGQLSAQTLSLEARVWWSCYAIERLMELETGRPSALTEQEIDQINFTQPQNSDGDSVTGPLHLFIMWVSLARIMGQISEHLYHRRISDSWQLLYETGRLDQLLLEWVKTVPEGIKPGHELVHLGPDAEDAESGHQHQHIAASCHCSTTRHKSRCLGHPWLSQPRNTSKRSGRGTQPGDFRRMSGCCRVRNSALRPRDPWRVRCSR